jgi:hypothetical protein
MDLSIERSAHAAMHDHLEHQRIVTQLELVRDAG